MQLKVCDFHDSTQAFFFDGGLYSGYASQRFNSPSKAEVEACGMGTLKKLGILRLREAFCAVYVVDGSVKLQIDDAIYDLSSGVVVTRTSVAPFIKSLVIRSQKSVNSYSYFGNDLFEDGMDYRDFFLYLGERLTDEKRRLEFTKFWMSKASPTTS